MRKKVVLIFVFILVFVSCVTWETHITDADYNYTVLPISQRWRLFLFGDEFTMGNYRLVSRGTNPSTERITTRRFDFMYGNNQLARVEITRLVEEATILFIIQTTQERWFIDVIKDGRRTTYHISEEPNIYLAFQNIIIKYYESRNRNQLDSSFLMHTGFSFFVDDDEFGILALYPSQFFLRKSNVMTHEMALYILMTFASHRLRR